MDPQTVPETLPTTPAQCATLVIWRTLVLGKSQQAVALEVGLSQGRITQVELGKVMPRKSKWARLMAAYGLPMTSEAEFYRMVLTARRQWLRLQAEKEGMKQPLQQTHPLLAQTTPTQTVGQVEGRTAALYDQAPVIGEAELNKKARGA